MKKRTNILDNNPTKKDLQMFLQEDNYKGYSALKKDELIDFIQKIKY